MVDVTPEKLALELPTINSISWLSTLLSEVLLLG
jgi:hypothetical protein